MSFDNLWVWFRHTISLYWLDYNLQCYYILLVYYYYLPYFISINTYLSNIPVYILSFFYSYSTISILSTIYPIFIYLFSSLPHSNLYYYLYPLLSLLSLSTSTNSLLIIYLFYFKFLFTHLSSSIVFILKCFLLIFTFYLFVIGCYLIFLWIIFLDLRFGQF